MGNGTFLRDGVVYAHEWAMESYTDDFGVSLDPKGYPDWRHYEPTIDR